MTRQQWTPAQRHANAQWSHALARAAKLKQAGADAVADTLYATLAQAVAEAVRAVLSTSNPSTGHPASPLADTPNTGVHARACSPAGDRPIGVQWGGRS